MATQQNPSPYPFVRTVASGMVATALPRPIVSEQPAPPAPMPQTVVAAAPTMQVVPQNLNLPSPNAPLQPVDLPKLLRSLEDSYIQAALTQTKGNRKAAADLLGLQRTTLVEKLRRRKKAGETSGSTESEAAHSEG